jgi:hypothetical protein
LETAGEELNQGRSAEEVGVEGGAPRLGVVRGEGLAARDMDTHRASGGTLSACRLQEARQQLTKGQGHRAVQVGVPGAARQPLKPNLQLERHREMAAAPKAGVEHGDSDVAAPGSLLTPPAAPTHCSPLRVALTAGGRHLRGLNSPTSRSGAHRARQRRRQTQGGRKNKKRRRKG